MSFFPIIYQSCVTFNNYTNTYVHKYTFNTVMFEQLAAMMYKLTSVTLLGRSETHSTEHFGSPLADSAVRTNSPLKMWSNIN